MEELEFKRQDKVSTYFQMEGIVASVDEEQKMFLVWFPDVKRSAWYTAEELKKVE